MERAHKSARSRVSSKYRAKELGLRNTKALSDKDLRDNIDAQGAIMLLHKCVRGEEQITPERIRAAEILLRKVLPDLATIEGNFFAEIVHNVVSWEPMNDDEWERKYCLEATAGPSDNVN